jgi:formate dehydrogenase subunit gamma
VSTDDATARPGRAARPVWSDEVATRLVSAHAGRRGPLLPALHALQEEFGYLDPRAVPLVAEVLNLSRADVYGVVTFYKDFRTTPPPEVEVRVCRAEACQARGAHELAEYARARLGDAYDEVFCLGNCALGPSVTVDGRLYGRVDAALLDLLVADARADSGATR